MAEKVSMLIVKVELDCHKCYDKMRKILCKLQDQERIRTISFDDKSNTVAIAGPFDAQRLACMIRCKGGKTVRDVQIIDVAGGGPPPKIMVVEPPPPPPVNHGKKKKKHRGKSHHAAEPPPPQPHQPEQEPAPQPPEPAPAPPPEMHMRPPASSPHHQPGTPDRGMAATMPPFHEEDRPKAQPAQLEPPPSPREQPPPVDYYTPPAALPPPPVMHHHPRPPTPPPCPKPPPVECVIPTVEIPSWPAAPLSGLCGCPCCATTSYQGYYEGCRCGCGGGRVYGGACAAAGPPLTAWSGYRGCRIINEEDPNAACSIM